MKVLTKEELDNMTFIERKYLVPGDIQDDEGRWRCPVCGTYKWNFISEALTKFGMDSWQWSICDCQLAQKEKERSDIKRREYRFACFPMRNQHEMTFERDAGMNPKITAVMKNYVENFKSFREKGQGLLLYGEPGTGKSYMACAVANALIDRLHRVKFTQIDALYRDYLNVKNRSEFLEDLGCSELIILDDLGVEVPAMKTFVFTLIDSLYVRRRPFIITTNLGIEELKNPADKYYQRIFSRILERCPFPILVSSGEGMRTKKIRADIGEYKKLLGIGETK